MSRELFRSKSEDFSFFIIFYVFSFSGGFFFLLMDALSIACDEFEEVEWVNEWVLGESVRTTS